MNNLCKDIYNHIFSFLTHKELINLMAVSKSFYIFIDNLKLPNVDFYTACQNGYYLNIRKLGIKNFNLNKALYFASKGGHKPIINLLIKNGANNWVLAFKGACKCGNKDLIEFMYLNIVKDYNTIIEQLNNCKNVKLKNYISKYLIEFLDDDSLDWLIEKYLDIWNIGLYYVCKMGHRDLIDYMIENGANYLERGIAGACKGGYKDIIDYLIKQDGYIWALALYYACQSGNKNIIEYIINIIQGFGHDYNYVLEGACKI